MTSQSSQRACNIRRRGTVQYGSANTVSMIIAVESVPIATSTVRVRVRFFPSGINIRLILPISGGHSSNLPTVPYATSVSVYSTHRLWTSVYCTVGTYCTCGGRSSIVPTRTVPGPS